jgi:hypothetical protein
MRRWCSARRDEQERIVSDGELEDWPFDQTPNTGAITVRSVLEGDPVLYVSHDLDDAGWQFLDGRPPETAEGRLIGMHHVLRSIQRSVRSPIFPRAGLHGGTAVPIRGSANRIRTR